MNNPTNGLSPSEVERLALLMEECAEVQHLIGKILRHGYESYHPKDEEKTPNRLLLAHELGHIEFAVDLMLAYDDVDNRNILNGFAEKECSAWKYLHYHKDPVNDFQPLHDEED